MIVRCVARYPTEEGTVTLGPNFWKDQSFGVKLGADYLVLGIFIAKGGRPFGSGPWIQFRNVDDQFGQAPLLMFDVIDHRLSRYWEAHTLPSGVLSFAPPSFNRDHYMEDYYEEVPEIVEDFHRICELLETEARSVQDSASDR